MRPVGATTVRFTPEDFALLRELRRRLGANTNTSVIRQALRLLLAHTPDVRIQQANTAARDAETV